MRLSSTPPTWTSAGSESLENSNAGDTRPPYPQLLRSPTQAFHLAQITSKIRQNCAAYTKSSIKETLPHVQGELPRQRTARSPFYEVPSYNMAPDKAGRVIFVGNIPYGLSEEQVVHLFSSCGQVLNFRLVYDKDTGRPKGFGFAEFSDADAAASAVRNLNGHEVMNRTLRVDYSNEAGGGGDSSNQSQPQAPNPSQNSQQQQNISQQQHFQQFQQMHQQQPPSQASAQPSLSLPPGVTLPDNVSAPDAISRTLSAMDPQQLLNVISQLKEMVNNEPQRAHALLTKSPQLSYAIFQALLLMGLVDTSVLSQVVDASGSQQPPQHAQAPLPFHQPHQSYPPQPPPTPQFPPQYQQHMGTPPVHGQTYPPPPQAIPAKPPQMTDQQWDSIRQLCSIPQQQIDSMPNPTERQSIMSIRQQYMPFFGGQYMGIPSY